MREAGGPDAQASNGRAASCAGSDARPSRRETATAYRALREALRAPAAALRGSGTARSERACFPYSFSSPSVKTRRTWTIPRCRRRDVPARSTPRGGARSGRRTPGSVCTGLELLGRPLEFRHRLERRYLAPLRLRVRYEHGGVFVEELHPDGVVRAPGGAPCGSPRRTFRQLLPPCADRLRVESVNAGSPNVSTAYLSRARNVRSVFCSAECCSRYSSTSSGSVSIVWRRMALRSPRLSAATSLSFPSSHSPARSWCRSHPGGGGRRSRRTTAPTSGRTAASRCGRRVEP